MPRFRLSALALADIGAILEAAERLQGKFARIRLKGLIAASLRRIAREPEGAGSAARAELHPGASSFHTRHARKESTETAIGHPVHVVYYRAGERGLVEIVRVLNERREPSTSS